MEADTEDIQIEAGLAPGLLVYFDGRFEEVAVVHSAELEWVVTGMIC